MRKYQNIFRFFSVKQNRSRPSKEKHFEIDTPKFGVQTFNQKFLLKLECAA